MITETEPSAETTEAPEQPEPKRRRNRNRASNIFRVPQIATTITHPDYYHALTGDSAKNAFLVATSSQEIKIQANMLVMSDGVTVRPSDDATLKQYYLADGLDQIDLPMLNVIFTALKTAIDMDKDTFLTAPRANGVYSMGLIHIYLPDIIAALGIYNGVTQDIIDRYVQKIKKYQSVVGYIRSTRSDGRLTMREYPLMSYAEYNITDNTIDLASPYMIAIYKDLMKPQRKAVKAKDDKAKKETEIQEIPNYTNLISTRLYGQRSDRAIAIVQELVVTLVRAGIQNKPHIKISTLISRIPEFADYLTSDAPTRDKNKALSRAFGSAWKYIDKYTLIKEKYRNVRIYCTRRINSKDVEIPIMIPTMGTLDMVINIEHAGLITDEAAPK